LWLLQRKSLLGFGIIGIISIALVACGMGTELETIENKDAVVESEGVIVVGAGAAGLAAAIAAADAGSPVILLEKLPVVGGSALCSGGVIYGANTPVQERAGIEDSVDALFAYWQGYTGENTDEQLLYLVSEGSGDTIAWLESLGVQFGELRPAGDSPVPRAHQPAAGRGAALISPLEQAAREKGVEILLETRGRELLTDDEGNVIGVQVENRDGERMRIYGRAVVLATGGFGCSTGLKEQYTPAAAGQVMARELGADIITPGNVIGFRGVGHNISIGHPVGSLITIPSLYVDSQGRRFVNEALDYPLFYEAMLANGDDTFYLILAGKPEQEILAQGIELGVVFRGETIVELSRAAGIDGAQLEQTIAAYNSYAHAGEDLQYGKDPQYLNAIEGPGF
jgi:fumarate reductase flavoprotein subunit